MPSGNDRRSDSGTAGRRGRRRRRDVLKLIGATGVAGLAGCSGNGGNDGGGESSDRSVQGTYVSASSVDAQSLNWLTIADATSGSYVTATLDGAWAIKPEREIFPLWADYSTDDGRVYEIELRENLEWGAGYGQMTAEDWVYMITNVFQARPNWSGYPNADSWFRMNPESSEREPIPVEQTGTRTFEIRLFEVDPSFPFKPVLWRQQCIPKGILEKYVPDQDTEGLQQDEELNTLAYTGNLGPYTYEQWERSARYTVTRNEDYYLKDVEGVPERFTEAPYFDQQVVRVISEESTRLGALESGEVDSAGIPPDKANRFENLPNVNVNVTPQPYARIIVYNMRANGWEPFRSKAVRRALAFAVNKETVVQNILRGYGQVSQTMQPKWSQWYVDSEVEEFGVGDRYGPEATRSRLESALSDTEYAYDGETLVDGSGEQVTLSIYYDSGQPTEGTIAEFIAQEFGENAGIDVQPEAVSSSTFQSNYVQTSAPEGTEPEWTAGVFNGGPRDVATSAEPWDMSINLQFNTYPFTPASSKGFFERQGGINYYGYYPDSDIAELYEQASATTDETRRQELFGRAFGLISEEQPFGFLAMPSSVSGYADNVRGYDEEFNTGWDSQTWYFA
ncbi:ABC transporter substrate-binding protein [Haloplanus aerogenes]|uniref:ABC transporter substrate-binding protein n=1 Tax=Haloplanus aerogenes TaxID=660522 RepID=A0A3M0DZD0_9EURY|nr:ABC transporter substrate-binding protein [Haloplanus aerogenes]AZH25551.1 ABC transporter substrate-binding protein [Haloplanus aerogenes]RMB25266.1 peptide/nickel transport system substrate-binding protein [Haloplanus aerogenes]